MVRSPNSDTDHNPNHNETLIVDMLLAKELGLTKLTMKSDSLLVTG